MIGLMIRRIVTIHIICCEKISDSKAIYEENRYIYFKILLSENLLKTRIV